jgi:hypothetical protein
MNVEFANQEIGRALSILATNEGRILERLKTAHNEALVKVNREDLPQSARERFDSIMAQLGNLGSLAEDDGSILATEIEDLAAVVTDEFFSR